MAKANILPFPNQEEFIPVDGIMKSSTKPLFFVQKSISKSDVLELLTLKMAHLTSMAQIITGEGEESFNSWNDEIRHNYLCAISMLADDCQALLELTQE
jgi:hypothetical protein